MTLAIFNEKLSAARSTEELHSILDQFLKSFDITTYAFTYYSYYPNSLNKVKFELSSANYSTWHNYYISEGYEDTDSTLDVVYQSALPIFWDLQSQLKEAKTPREKQMREDSIAYGVEKGLSIPIHGPQEDFAILLLLQMRNQKPLNNINESQFEFFSAAYYFYHHLQRILLTSQANHPVGKLSVREIQCLTLLSKQYSLEAIAKELNLTERTVNYHIQRLNKKLGTQNKYQSVIKALKKGLLKF